MLTPGPLRVGNKRTYETLGEVGCGAQLYPGRSFWCPCDLGVKSTELRPAILSSPTELQALWDQGPGLLSREHFNWKSICSGLPSWYFKHISFHFLGSPTMGKPHPETSLCGAGAWEAGAHLGELILGGARQAHCSGQAGWQEVGPGWSHHSLARLLFFK